MPNILLLKVILSPTFFVASKSLKLNKLTLKDSSKFCLRGKLKSKANLAALSIFSHKLRGDNIYGKINKDKKYCHDNSYANTFYD